MPSALVVDSLIPGIAHQLYPNLFKTDAAFSTTATGGGGSGACVACAV